MNDLRRFSGAAVLACGLLFSAGTVHADPYPTKAITFVVPRAPGGGSDVLMRLVASGLSKVLTVPIVIENRPDSTAIIGAQFVARSIPDGYTLYVSDNSFYQNPAILDHIPYDTIKDFSAVTMMANAPVILLLNPSVPAKDVGQLVQLVKQDPGKYSFASGGIGASTHLAGVLFNDHFGTSMIHVPYKSSGEAINALLGNHVTMEFGGISSAKSLIAAGRVRAIAVTGDRRDPNVPDVPTLQELGIAGADVTSLWGIHAPAGTPLEVREKLRAAIVTAMNDPQLKRQLNELGYTIVGNTPEQHQQQTNDTVQFWIDLSKKVDLKH